MLAFILPLLLKWIPGGLLTPIFTYLGKRADSKNEALRIEVQREIDLRQHQRDVLVAEQGWWFTAMIRPLLALPVVIYVWKVIFWDKVLGLGVTDPIDGAVGEWAGLIIGAYILGEAGVTAARVLKR